MRKIEPQSQQKGMEFGQPGKKKHWKLKDESLTPVELASGMVKKHGSKKAIEILYGYARETFGSGEAVTPNPQYNYYLNALNWAKNRAPKDQK